jgi:hypothetical protein
MEKVMRKILLVAAFSWTVSGAWAQAKSTESSGVTTLQLCPFWLQASPQLAIPLGDSDTYYTMGLGGLLIGEYRLPFLPLALARVAMDYGYNPIKAAKSVSFISASAGFGFS